ncbi:MAG: ATP-binding protein [Chromatiales bacterium]
MLLASLCLRYLLLLRAIAMGGQVIALVVAHVLLDTPVPWASIAIVMGLLALVTVRSWRRITTQAPVSEASVLHQLCIDIAALAVLLYFTGGSWNPFASLFLLPITVAAATLRSAYTWLLVGCAAACYTALMFFHVHTLHWVHEDDRFSPHLWGMWLGFLLSAGIVAYFVARIGATLRVHDRELARARELIALGTLAAGTAHELGTPLATMAVVARELERDHGDKASRVEGLRVLRSQVGRCKEILARMASGAGQAPAEAGARVSIDRYLDEIIGEWRVLRPEVTATVRLAGVQPPPQIVADRTLSQVFINILNNAADASPGRVEVEGTWSASELKLEIRDEGDGLPAAMHGHVGEAFVSTKAGGMGLGLYLARTTLDRLGGRLELRKGIAGRGVSAAINLPLTGLLA